MIKKAKLVIKKDKTGKATSIKLNKSDAQVTKVSNSYKASRSALDTNYTSYVRFDDEVLKMQFSV